MPDTKSKFYFTVILNAGQTRVRREAQRFGGFEGGREGGPGFGGFEGGREGGGGFEGGREGGGEQT